VDRVETARERSPSGLESGRSRLDVLLGDSNARRGSHRVESSLQGLGIAEIESLGLPCWIDTSCCSGD
jgi:hypothetical protein